MVDWQALEGIGGIATAVAVFIALVFGIAQVRLQAAQRRETATTVTVGEFLQPGLVESADLILQLEDDADPAAITSNERIRRAVLHVNFAIEYLGAYVYDGTLDLHSVDRFIGGFVRVGWRKLRRYMDAERARLGTPNIGEWWQWLVERLDEDPAPGKALGAHVAFRKWRA